MGACNFSRDGPALFKRLEVAGIFSDFQNRSAFVSIAFAIEEMERAAPKGG